MRLPISDFVHSSAYDYRNHYNFNKNTRRERETQSLLSIWHSYSCWPTETFPVLLLECPIFVAVRRLSYIMRTNTSHISLNIIENANSQFCKCHFCCYSLVIDAIRLCFYTCRRFSGSGIPLAAHLSLCSRSPWAKPWCSPCMQNNKSRRRTKDDYKNIVKYVKQNHSRIRKRRRRRSQWSPFLFPLAPTARTKKATI